MTGGPDREGGGTGPIVVLLHGFGAPGQDLVPLWRVLDVPDAVRFVFPAAPIRLFPNYGDGRAWWMIDMERLAREQAEGRDRDIRLVPDGLSQAREHIITLLKELEARYQLQSGQLILGGFSQGAMLAYDAALHTTIPLAGLALLSTTIIAYDEWVERIPARRMVPVFQSHGTDDPVLSFRIACQFREALRSHDVNIAWHEFRGGHEIPMSVLSALGPFIHNAIT